MESLLAWANRENFPASFLLFSLSDQTESSVFYWRKPVSFLQKKSASYTARNSPIYIWKKVKKGEILWTIFLSHNYCYTACSALWFKYSISIASRIATKITNEVKEISWCYSNCESFGMPFQVPCPHISHPALEKPQTPSELWALASPAPSPLLVLPRAKMAASASGVNWAD